MSERGPDIGRMIAEELKKSPPKSEVGAKPVDIEGASVDEEADDMIDNLEVRPDHLPGTKVDDLGSRAAAEVQKAFSGKNLAELGSIVDKFVSQAKDAGVDEAQARAALKKQLGLFHDTYKEAGLDAQAAEIDSFARSLENANEVSSDQGKALAEMIDSGMFADMGEFNAALDKRMKGADNKIPGTEVNVLIAKAADHFKAEEDAINATQTESGINASESDIDDMLGGFDEIEKAS